MKKLITGVIIIYSSTIIANEIKYIQARVTYSIEKNKVIAAIVTAKNKEDKRKCEEEIKSKEAQALFKKQYKNHNKKEVSFKYTCVLT